MRNRPVFEVWRGCFVTIAIDWRFVTALVILVLALVLK